MRLLVWSVGESRSTSGRRGVYRPGCPVSGRQARSSEVQRVPGRCLTCRCLTCLPPLPRCSAQDGEYVRGEVFYFDYGCLAFWGLSERAEREVLRLLVAPALVDALPHGEVEVDEFQVRRRGGW